DRQAIAADVARVCAHFPILGERRRQMAGTLSGGEQQMLAIGRALMSRPRLILLDEPSLGLAPTIVETTLAIIAEIRREGTTVLMVEQNAYLALRMADRGYVMETGRGGLDGGASDLLADDHVRPAHLGARADFRGGRSNHWSTERSPTTLPTTMTTGAASLASPAATTASVVVTVS